MAPARHPPWSTLARAWPVLTRYAPLGALLPLALVPPWLSARVSRVAYDDAYITYRYAASLLAGSGFLYNPGEHVLGTTTPFYTLVLAALGKLWPDLPALSRVLSGLFGAASTILAYGIAARMGGWRAGLLAACGVALSPLLLAAFGMETPLYLALAAAACYAYLAGHLSWCALCLGCLVLTRADGVLLVAVLGSDYLWRNGRILLRERRLPWQPLLCFVALVLPWFVFSTLRFGSPFPNSLAAKMGQASKVGLSDVGGARSSFLAGLLSLARQRWLAHPLYALWGLLPLVALCPRRSFDGRRLLPLAWMILYVCGYMAMGVVAFPWYYVPLVLPLAWLGGLGGQDVALWLAARLPPPQRWTRAALASGVTGIALLATILLQRPLLRAELAAQAPRLDTYQRVGTWLRENTVPTSSVVTIEIGIIGYFAQREIIDTMGLVTPGLTHHLWGWLQTIQYALLRYQPDYAVVLPQTAWEGVRNEAWFSDRYALEHRVDDVLLYRRRADAPAYAYRRDTALRVGPTARVTAVELPSPLVVPSSTLNLAVHWHTDAPIAEDYIVQLALVDPLTGRDWAKTHGQPMQGGCPTFLWRVGDEITDEHRLAIPPDIPAGRYELRLGASVEGNAGWEAFPLRDGQGNLLSEMVPLVSIKVPAAQAPTCPATLQPLAVRIGEAVRLSGIGVAASARAGEELAVELCWRAEGSWLPDQAVFVHLVDDKGAPLAQADGQPREGRYPLSIWEAGEEIPDRYRLALPPAMSPGRYRLLVGLYSPQTGVRLPAWSAQGERLASDAAPVATVEVSRPGQ